MTGFLASEGFRVSQNRVGFSLKRIDPLNHSKRRSHTHRAINPTPYFAKYFGEKLHIDQNEKLIAFGVTHVCAVDSFSGKIVGFTSMAIKSNVIIYNDLYRYVEQKLILSINYVVQLIFHSPGCAKCRLWLSTANKS